MKPAKRAKKTTTTKQTKRKIKSRNLRIEPQNHKKKFYF